MIVASPAQNSAKGCAILPAGTLAAMMNAPSIPRPWPTAISRFEPASCALVMGSVCLEMIRNSGANAQNITARKISP